MVIALVVLCFFVLALLAPLGIDPLNVYTSGDEAHHMYEYCHHNPYAVPCK